MALYYLDPNPGGKRPILLLHGLGADGESWGLQFVDLAAAGFRPLAVDLPGFGRSAAPHGRWTLRLAAAAVVDLLRELGYSRVDVVGHSLGGAVAQTLALDFPDLVRSLTLVNTFACLRPRTWSETRYLMRRFVVANLRGVRHQAGAVAWRVFPRADQAALRDLLIQKILAADPAVYRAAMRELALFDSRPRLATITAPVLIITGAEDTTVALKNQRELAAIPGARQVIVPGANHAITIDQPQRFNQELLDFLNHV